jgi:xanthine dehydrogenase YagS FAD-binding subunit
MATPKSFKEASGLLTDSRFKLPVLKAGGQDVLDHLKEGLIQPDVLIDIRRLRSGAAGTGDDSSLTIEAMTTLAEIASSQLFRKAAPVLPQSIESAASPQVRNAATAAGNLLQRPRCWYYRNEQFDCLKKGGPTCYAVEGENRYHAIFGDGPCHIVHPSNLAPALWVCRAVIHVVGGKRDEFPITELFHMPDKGVKSEHNLQTGEVVTHITCQGAPHSGFYSIKEKQSFDWPLVTAAVALDLQGTTIKSARVCAGAVAPTPWPLPGVEVSLEGVDVADDAALRKACAGSIQGARPMSGNAFKLKLLPVAVRRAVLKAAGRKTEVDA